MRIRSDSMIRCAARPVTNVSPISSTRSTSVTTRNTPAAAKRTTDDPFATPSSSPVFTSTGPARVINPSITTKMSPSSNGRRNSRSSRSRLKFLSGRDSRSRSTAATSRTGRNRATRASSSGVGARLSRQPDPPPRPGPGLGAPMDRAAARLPERWRSPAHAAAVTPSAPAVDAIVASASMESDLAPSSPDT